MSKWKCDGCSKSCVQELDCCPGFCMMDGKDAVWLEVKEQESNQLPKLTEEVFNRPDCPAWAKWAAVDKSGVVFFYENKPICTGTCYQSIIGATKIIDSSIKWDIANHQNILIERPEPEFPEWCQKGKWVCTYDRFKKEWEYFKVNETKRNCISSDNGLEYSFYDLKQARVRPWTAREAIGKIVCWKGDYSFQENMATINAVDCDGDLMGDLLGNINLEDLTKKCFYQLNGNPCGVLEHLENEEWVE